MLLYERAEEAQKLIRSQQENVDPFELLAAVVWPSPEMLEAQIAARNAA